MNPIITLHIENIIITLKNNQVVFAYLFGSVVRHKMNKMSDIDFAVCFPENFTSEQMTEHRLNLMLELNSILKRPIDILVLNNRYDELVMEVLRFGELLFEEDPSQRAQFRYQFTRHYLNFLPNREKYYHLMLLRLKQRKDSDERINQHQKSIKKIRRMSFDIKRDS